MGALVLMIFGLVGLFEAGAWPITARDAMEFTAQGFIYIGLLIGILAGAFYRKKD